MGGTALRHLGFEGRRVSKEEYKTLVFEIKEKYSSHFFHLEDILHYSDKPDHGDIDFVAWTNLNLNVKDILDCTFYSKNSCVHSFDYKGVQIDLALLNDFVSYNRYYLFCCYSPIGNVLGRLLKQKGLKWGIDGLTYPIKLSDSEQLGEIRITNCIEYENAYGLYRTMLDFMGIKHNFGEVFMHFKNYFTTQEEIFKWVCSSSLFNKDVFAFENLNHVNRKRDRLRKDYHQWLEFIKDKPNNFVGSKDKTTYIDEISSYFNINIHEQAEKLISTHAYNKFLKEKFNGKMVQEWTSLQGRELGRIINAYKDSIENFNNFIQLKPVEYIEKDFKMFYSKFNGK